MAKARGNKLVPPANYSRNPMTLVGEGRSAPLPPGNFGVYRQNSPFFVQGTDQKTGQSVTAPISGKQYAGFNNPFNWEGPLEPTTGGSIAPVANRTPVPLVAGNPVLPAMQRQTASIRNAANQINALTTQSQQRFPATSNPMSMGVDPATESTRRLAPMLAQDAARRQNTPMNGMTAYEANPLRLRPDQKLNLAEQNAARYASGGAAADPTGMAGRFNPMAGQINAQADAVASGRGWYLGGQFVGATGNPQWGTAENMRRRVELNNAPQQATQEQRESAQARRAGAHRQFMEENNGMNYLQARRAERQAGLKERSFRKAVTRGLNPMSPEAQALFPQQVAKMKGQSVAQANQNPMGSPIAAGAPNTAENLQARNSIRAGITQGVPATATTPAIPPSPFIQSLGVTADASPADVETGLNDMMLRDEVPSPEGLKDLRILVGTYTGMDGESPFASTEVPDSWDALRNLPENASDEQLKSWWNSHQEKVKALRQRQMEQGRLRGIGRIGA